MAVATYVNCGKDFLLEIHFGGLKVFALILHLFILGLYFHYLIKLYAFNGGYSLICMELKIMATFDK